MDHADDATGTADARLMGVVALSGLVACLAMAFLLDCSLGETMLAGTALTCPTLLAVGWVRRDPKGGSIRPGRRDLAALAAFLVLLVVPLAAGRANGIDAETIRVIAAGMMACATLAALAVTGRPAR